jgi:hypothetical protein
MLGIGFLRVKSSAGTNQTLIKNAPGAFAGCYLYNNTAAVIFFKVFNLASAPVAGVSTPAFTLAIPPAALGPVIASFEYGLRFNTGMSYCIVTGIADTDSTAVAVDDVTGFIYFR